jgi:excisionase family DNA binding protein
MSTKEERGWNIHRRGDGQNILQYRIAAGDWAEHRIPREHRSERAAERYAMTWLSTYRKVAGTRPSLPDAPERGKSIRDLADAWETLTAKNPKISPATRKQRKGAIEVHVLPYPEIADVPISDLGPAALRGWVRKVRDDGKTKPKWEKDADGRPVRKLVRGGPMAAFTCRNVVNSLTAFFADAMAEEWIDVPANPMKHEAVRREIPDGVTVAGKHTIVHLTRPVAEKLLASAAVPEWRRVRTLLALVSGMAEGELSGLKLDDLDLDAAVPIVKITKALALEGDDGYSTMRAPKTDNRVRVMPLHSLAVRELRAWKAAGWKAWVGHKPEPHHPLFPNASGEAWRPDSPSLLRADLLAAGLTDKYDGKHAFTAHATRRSFATWLTEAGVAESTIKRLMGHAGSGVTQQHYTAQSLATLKAAIECIVLDLTTGQLVALPMRAVGGSHPEPQAAGHTADLPRGLPRPAVSGSSKPAILKARPVRLERTTGDLEVERGGSAPVSSASQAVGIVRDREARTVQPSQPLAPFRSPFGPPVVQGSDERGSPLRVVAGAGGRLMKVREVAEALGVCTATVYELVDEGELPHVRVANAIRVTQADLAHYVACRRRERCGRISHR